MTTQTPPFKNGDIVIFNSEKWKENYGVVGCCPYRVLVTDYVDGEAFIGTYLDNNLEMKGESDEFLTNYFEKVVDATPVIA